MQRAIVRGLDHIKAQYQLALTGGNLMRLVNMTDRCGRRTAPVAAKFDKPSGMGE